MHRPPPRSPYFSRRKPSSTHKRNKPRHFLLQPHHATAYNLFVLHRAPFAFLAIFLWMAAPLLACLPNSSMTRAEMDCCKKMAGNCEMGGSNHKCCDTTANHSASPATIVQSSALHVFFPLLLGASQFNMAFPHTIEPPLTTSFPTSASPPSLSAILRN